jgi:hypothetical protein
MGLIAVLMSRLRMLLCSIGLLLALGVIAFAVVLGGAAMRLGGVLVVLGSLVVFVSGHGLPRWLSAPSRRQIGYLGLVPARLADSPDKAVRIRALQDRRSFGFVLPKRRKTSGNKMAN